MDGADVVAQFTEVTGSTPELATQYLQLTDFNIEQATMLYFENGGAPLTEDPAPPYSASHDTSRDTSSRAVRIDSDDDVVVDERRSTPRNGPHPAPTSGLDVNDDEAMARRLQEELYSGGGGSDDVRAPMARTTETLVGPEAEFDDDMNSHILRELRYRQSRGGS